MGIFFENVREVPSFSELENYFEQHPNFLENNSDFFDISKPKSLSLPPVPVSPLLLPLDRSRLSARKMVSKHFPPRIPPPIIIFGDDTHEDEMDWDKNMTEPEYAERKRKHVDEACGGYLTTPDTASYREYHFAVSRPEIVTIDVVYSLLFVPADCRSEPTSLSPPEFLTSDSSSFGDQWNMRIRRDRHSTKRPKTQHSKHRIYDEGQFVVNIPMEDMSSSAGSAM